MSTAPRYDEWDALVALLQQYARRKYGQPATAFTLHLIYPGNDHREPLPQLARHEPPPAVAAPPLVGWASGDEPKFLSDCQRVYWPGLGEFRLSAKQAAAVQLLREAMEEGTDDVPQAELLRAADSDCTRLRDLFSRSPAWGRLVVQGLTPGSYRLPCRGDEREEIDP